MEERNNQLDLFAKDTELALDEAPASVAMLLGGSTEKAERIAEHRLQLASIRKQYPHPAHPYKIGVYIRYFNQTKYENYLEKHISHFKEAIALCPKWTLVDFYIDEGQTAPSMASAPEWCRLLEDCFSGKVDLIITQKVSNVARKDNPREITFISGILASQPHPVGIYFVSENIFTLATYYLEDMNSLEFFPEGQKKLCDGEPVRGYIE
jgi:hypothetical protein